MLFSGRARLRESYDEKAECCRINLEVHNSAFGFLFGYEGTFTCEYPAATDSPTRLRPVRHERRF